MPRRQRTGCERPTRSRPASRRTRHSRRHRSESKNRRRERLRILITCPNCHRRYDASRFGVGERVRCSCGQSMRVQAPRGHDAAVVRCSSCGSPRDGGQDHCGFCDSEFTLHERDLHTVCPQCLARVSDRARYCHSCGDRLTSESIAGKASAYSCPACGQGSKLFSRRLGKERVSVAECQKCAGLWIHQSSFCHLRDRVARQAADVRMPPRPTKRRRHEPIRYRPCVECGRLMNRHEYASGCGVVVDVCREHGIWFDDEELADVLRWISLGGKGKPRSALRPQADPPPVGIPLKSPQPHSQGAGTSDEFGLFSSSQEDNVDDLVADVLQAALAPLARFLDL